jgi:hypothetical protein
MRRGSFTEVFERKVRLFYQETLFIRGSENYVKDGSGNGQFSPQGYFWETWRVVRFSADFERQMEGSEKGACLSVG